MKEKPGISAPPAWLDLPAAPPEKTVLDESVAESSERDQEYWACFSILLNQPKPARRRWFRQEATQSPLLQPRWQAIFRTMEEANAYAARSEHRTGPWPWNGEPAMQVKLSSIMQCARQAGDFGVRLVAYNSASANWEIIKSWPVDVPLT